MFINILKRKYTREPGLKMTGLYECDRFLMKPLDDEGRPDFVIVTMESDARAATYIELDKRKTEIYVMNEEGRTVDSYNWPAGYAMRAKSAAGNADR